jgi:uncharacterized phage protein (TIGR01671 family)
MQRLIKFRGKRVYNGEWIFGDLLRWGDSGDKITIIPHIKIEEIDVEKLEVIPETVGQFIGKNDKNGVEIFKGSIIRENEYFNANYEVIWDEENCRFLGRKIDDRDGNTLEFPQLAETGEIIGTIHDNPEMIEAPND